jgi:F0F1-type ATP synthase assembly protein I
MAGPPGTSPGQDAEARRLWRLAGMGFTLASEIAAGALIGWLVDSLAGTRSRWIVVGTIAGVVVGLFTFIRQALGEGRKAAREGERVGASQARGGSRYRSYEDHPDAGGDDD